MQMTKINKLKLIIILIFNYFVILGKKKMKKKCKLLHSAHSLFRGHKQHDYRQEEIFGPVM